MNIIAEKKIKSIRRQSSSAKGAAICKYLTFSLTSCRALFFFLTHTRRDGAYDDGPKHVAQLSIVGSWELYIRVESNREM